MRNQALNARQLLALCSYARNVSAAVEHLNTHVSRCSCNNLTQKDVVQWCYSSIRHDTGYTATLCHYQAKACVLELAGHDCAALGSQGRQDYSG